MTIRRNKDIMKSTVAMLAIVLIVYFSITTMAEVQKIEDTYKETAPREQAVFGELSRFFVRVTATVGVSGVLFLFWRKKK